MEQCVYYEATAQAHVWKPIGFHQLNGKRLQGLSKIVKPTMYQRSIASVGWQGQNTWINLDAQNQLAILITALYGNLIGSQKELYL